MKHWLYVSSEAGATRFKASKRELNLRGIEGAILSYARLVVDDLGVSVGPGGRQRNETEDENLTERQTGVFNDATDNHN